MNTSDIANISKFHNKLMAIHGMEGIDAVGWVSNESQTARYKVLAELVDATGKTVMDAGCGHADLFAYLSKIYTGIRYIGIEQMPELIDVAIKRYGHLTNTQFLQADFSEEHLPAADYVIACGSLSYYTTDVNYIFKTIEKLFAHCRIGFAFNLLSYLKYPDAAIVSYDPSTILSFCKGFTSNTTLKDGYWDNDFTIMMYH